MGAIKAIETEYRGHLMRSRLEARWGVFFDALRIEWRYEPQGFELPSGRLYLPDFQLPDHDLWVEVKGDEASLEADASRLAEFAFHVPSNGLMILGPVPDTNLGVPQHLVLNLHEHCCRENVLCVHVAWAEMLTRPDALRELGLPCADLVEHRDTALPGLKGYAGGSYVAPNPVPYQDWDPGIAAYRAARSARFEHGESGAML